MSCSPMPAAAFTVVEVVGALEELLLHDAATTVITARTDTIPISRTPRRILTSNSERAPDVPPFRDGRAGYGPACPTFQSDFNLASRVSLSHAGAAFTSTPPVGSQEFLRIRRKILCTEHTQSRSHEGRGAQRTE